MDSWTRHCEKLRTTEKKSIQTLGLCHEKSTATFYVLQSRTAWCFFLTIEMDRTGMMIPNDARIFQKPRGSGGQQAGLITG